MEWKKAESGIRISLETRKSLKRSNSSKRASPLGSPAVGTPVISPRPLLFKQGAKPAEVYGFVGSIISLVAYVLYVLWAYLPEPWLHALGVTYYPSRYWAIALPTYFPVVVVLGILVYTSLSLMSTQPLDSLSSICDKHMREPSKSSQDLPEGVEDEGEGDGDVHRKAPIPPISDLPIEEVSRLLYGPGSALHQQFCESPHGLDATNVDGGS